MGTMPPPADTPDSISPWRGVFERVRRVAANERDGHGVIGSINWLRFHMESRGANPNVVRNIIYRDKGKLHDKRVLFEILNDLWTSRNEQPLQVPELQALLSPGSGQDQEVLQLLGREKRRAYRAFVQGVRGGSYPKLVITGRPGSGKTLLSDYIQQALETPPMAADRVVRLEFLGTDVATALERLGSALGVPLESLEARLVKVGTSSAFAVQADAQADVARLLLDAARHFEGSQVLLLHVSQSLGGQDTLAHTALRLNTPDVPRVSASEWLWLSLFEPLSRMASCSVLVSMTDLPARAAQRLGPFEGPMKLTPPTTAEARRFVRARLPGASPADQEEIVQRAGRSFEELRTLTLLAEIRGPDADAGEHVSDQSITQLSHLVATCSDARLRGFLTSLAVLSLPEFPQFAAEALAALRPAEQRELNQLESAFLDPVPGQRSLYRCFSRRLAKGLREALAERDPQSYREQHALAALWHRRAAHDDATGEAARRYLSHLFEARDWDALGAWMAEHRTQQSLVRRVWVAASAELHEGPELRRLALQVARHYVARGSYQHRDARDAFAVLSTSEDTDVRVWTALQRVEGLVLQGHLDQAEALLSSLAQPGVARLQAEAALARASIARWRGSLSEAERLVTAEVNASLRRASDDPETLRTRVRARMWSGLIAKDRGELSNALACFELDQEADDLMAARIAFQRGDVLMRLGRFDAALAAFDTAVELAQRSEALVAEQTRYLTRRATLRRRRGELEAAAADFAAARDVLQGVGSAAAEAQEELGDETEHGFWAARVDDEASLNLLALGRYDEALQLLERNVQRFRRHARAQGVDGAYRVLRSTVHLSVAYGCRGARQPLRRPFAIGPALSRDDLDLVHSRALAEHVIACVESAGDALRLGALYRDALLSGNLFARDGETSLELALRALTSSRYPYQRAQAHSHAAVGALRCGDAARCEEHVQAAREALATTLADAGPSTNGAVERGDVELMAWLYAMDASAALLRGDAEAAGARLASVLQCRDLSLQHEAILFQVAEAAERSGLSGALLTSPAGRLLGLEGEIDTHPLRLADALVACWRRLRRETARRPPSEAIAAEPDSSTPREPVSST